MQKDLTAYDPTGKLPRQEKLPKFRDIHEIMTNPTMKAKLASYVDEAVRCKGKIAFEQENIKALRENAAEELGLKPAVFNDYVSMVYSNDYVQRKSKYEELVDLVTAVMQDGNLLPGAPGMDD